MCDESGNRDGGVSVTLEMINAGALALARYHPDFENLEDGARRIFEAMMAAAAAIEGLDRDIESLRAVAKAALDPAPDNVFTDVVDQLDAVITSTT